MVVGSEPLIVVRGDDLDPEILRADALRFHRRYSNWGRFGLSAFGAADNAEVDILCETRMERFEVVIVFARPNLEDLGIEVVPTFRRPHLTLAHTDLDTLVAALLTCDHRRVMNPHHGPGSH